MCRRPYLADHKRGVTADRKSASHSVSGLALDFVFILILGDPGAVSRAGRKGATKGLKHRLENFRRAF